MNIEGYYRLLEQKKKITGGLECAKTSEAKKEHLKKGGWREARASQRGQKDDEFNLAA